MLPTLTCPALSALYISGHGFQVIDITYVRGLIAKKMGVPETAPMQVAEETSESF
jgi:hypothetical protein